MIDAIINISGNVQELDKIKYNLLGIYPRVMLAVGGDRNMTLKLDFINIF